MLSVPTFVVINDIPGSGKTTHTHKLFSILGMLYVPLVITDKLKVGTMAARTDAELRNLPERSRQLAGVQV